MFRYFLLICAFITSSVMAQEASWSGINAGNSELPNETIKCMTFDTAGALWIGTYMGGIAVKENDNWSTYNTSNSDLPHNYINCIAIDKNNVKWIGTDGGGLTKYDDRTWEVYKTSNSGLPSNVVMSVFCDDDGAVWVGTYFGGLAKFDGETWTVYDDQNSPLLSNKVVVINKDLNDLIWFGTQGGGVASFDGRSWNIYTERNSKLKSDYIYSIDIDSENNKWIGTGGGGVAVFNDVFWINFNSENSSLTDDNVRPIYIDRNDDKWIGTYIGGINFLSGENWKVYDYQNSGLPDDEITCFGSDGSTLFIGTERSGIMVYNDAVKTVVPVIPEEIVVVEEVAPVIIPTKDDTSGEQVISEPEVEEPTISATAQLLDTRSRNKIVLVFDAADVYFDKKRLERYQQSFKLLLKNRERIDDTYDITILIYSSNFDVNPKKVQFSEKELKIWQASNVIYLEGESTFTEGINKAFKQITNDYNPDGNNHVVAATFKFIRDDEKAYEVVKENADRNYITFSLLAFDTEGWKMEYKVRDIVPKGQGYYYSLNKSGIKDNWSVTAQIGLSVFRGDMDVSGTVAFPGIYGFAINKKVLSTGILNGGIKGQFNFGKLKGEKNDYSFENKYKEGTLNFQVILNTWFNRNFRFETFRPYAFVGIGFINYRVLLRNGDGNVVNGYGYKVTEGDKEANGQNPEKDDAVTNLMIPLGVGVNYKLNEKFNLELEASSRFINSDQLDGKVNGKNDKYWFFSLGITYKFNTKEFLFDKLNR